MMDDDLIHEILQHHILHWNFRGYDDLPIELRLNGSHIKEIYMKMNNLRSLPIWVGDLKNVTNLYISQNKLENLPEELCEMRSLEILDVCNNLLKDLPPSIGLLTRLKTLLIMNNKITSFPPEMNMLPAIVTINGSGNLITSIEEICNCFTLEELYLDRNLIVSLPQKVVYMPKLKTLTLSKNNLIYLPNLPFISDVDILFDHNPSMNYIPYPLGCQITAKSLFSINGQWDLRTNGLSEISWGTEPLPNYKLLLSSGERLIMPLGLTLIKNSSGVSSPLTLQELSIQALYRMIYNHKLYIVREKGKHSCRMTRLLCRKPSFLKEVFNTLNRDLRKLILRGPISICLSQFCGAPIFSQCVVWVIQKRIAHRLRASTDEVFSTLLFCSHDCSRLYKEYLLSNNCENWEEELIRSQKPWVLVE